MSSNNSSTRSNETASFNFLTGFLCTIGGAELAVLQNNPSDKRRFLVVGILICMTSLMSFITMSFAIDAMLAQSPTQYKLSLILLGAFAWASIIFAIDFALINTMKTLPFEFSFNWFFQIIIPTLTRLSIAALISFTISKPFEVWYFKEVMKPYIPSVRDQQFQRDKETGLLSTKEVVKELVELSKKDSITRADEKDDPEIEKYKSEIEDLEGKLSQEQEKQRTESNKKKSLVQACNKNYVEGTCPNEAEIDRLTKNIKSYNLNIGQLKEDISTKEDDIIKIKNKYKNIRDRITEAAKAPEQEKRDKDAVRLKNERIAEALYDEVYNPNNPPLSVSLSTLEVMKQDPKYGKEIANTSLLLFLIILAIDVLPIIIKLFTAKIGNYEREIAAQERQKKYLLREEYKINKMVANSIASAQREIIKAALKKYKETETDRINDDPDAHKDYFSNGNTTP